MVETAVETAIETAIEIEVVPLKLSSKSRSTLKPVSTATSATQKPLTRLLEQLLKGTDCSIMAPSRPVTTDEMKTFLAVVAAVVYFVSEYLEDKFRCL